MNALVDEALEQNQLDLAWPVIRQVLPYQQSLWIALQNDLEKPKVDLTDPSVQAWNLFIEGKYDEMLKSAAPVNLKADLALRAFQWQAFKDPDLMAGVVGRRASVGQKAARAVMLEFAGELAESEAIWDAILPPADFAETEKTPAEKTPAEKTPEDKTPERDSEEAGDEDEVVDEAALLAAEALRFRSEMVRTDRATLETLERVATDPANLDRLLVSMLLTGRAQAVQDYMLENAPADAWSLCLTRGNQAAAMTALGLAPDLSNFDRWLAKCRADLHSDANQFFDRAVGFRSAVLLANNLQALGLTERADQLFDVLVSVCLVSRQRTQNYWEMLATSMTRAESRRRFLDIVTTNEMKLDENIRDRILSILYPECSMSAAVLFANGPMVKDEKGRPSKWEALEQLYLYNREPFEPQANKTLGTWLRRARASLSSSDELSAMQLGELALLADGIGQPELALEFARESSQASIELWAYAGKTLQDRGDLKSALEYFSAVRRMDSGHQEAIVDEANTMLMLGRVSEAAELRKSRWLRPLMVYGGSSWFTVARRLSEAKRFELAREYIEPAFLLSGVDDSENLTMKQPIFVATADEFTRIADELKEVELSADLHRAMFGVLLSAQKTRSYPVSVYASLGSKERTRRAILAARSGDMAAFERHATVAEDLQPQGIELVEDTFHELVASGNQATAEKWFARYEQRLLAHLEQWPTDATSHNNLAWMYARCNLKLEEALEHSQTAVELSPHSPVLLDTLAEVQFRLNHRSAAIHSMQRCIQLDPRDPHFRRQLERFLQAAE